MDRKPILFTDCLVDVTYMCEWCGTETKRAVREPARRLSYAIPVMATAAGWSPKTRPGGTRSASLRICSNEATTKPVLRNVVPTGENAATFDLP